MNIASFLPEQSPHLPRPSAEVFLDSLVEGDILQGQVQKQVDGETWVIRVSGSDILARSSASLAQGRSITVRVDSLGPPVLLSLVESDAGPNPEQALATALAKAGVRDDPVSRSIVQRMLESGLPVSGAEVEVVRRALRRLSIRDGGGMKGAVDHILKLRQRSIPVTAESMSLMLPEKAGTAVGRAIEGILRDLAESSVDSPDILDLLERIAKVFVPSDRVDAQALSRAVEDGGLHLESRLARLLASGAGDRALGDDLKGLLSRLAALVQGRLTDAASDEVGRLQNAGVLDRITTTVRLIEAFQVTAFPPDRSDGASLIYIYVPMASEGNHESVGVKITCRGKDGKRSVDPGATTIGLEFDLAALGRVEASVTIAGRAIDGRIDTEDSERGAYIRKAATDLGDSLGRLGYDLRSLDVGLVSLPECPVKEAKRPSQVGFDVRV